MTDALSDAADGVTQIKHDAESALLSRPHGREQIVVSM